MLGNARGGMAGTAPNNQVAPSTQYPGMVGMAQPGMPGMPGMQQWPAQPYQVGMPAQPVPDGMMQGQPGISPEMMQQGQMPQVPAQPLQAGQPGMGQMGQMGQFQAPGNAGMGATAMQASPMAQPMGMQQPGPGGQPQVAVGAFSQALNRNRLVPKSGAMGQQGAMMSMQGIQQADQPPEVAGPGLHAGQRHPRRSRPWAQPSPPVSPTRTPSPCWASPCLPSRPPAPGP